MYFWPYSSFVNYFYLKRWSLLFNIFIWHCMDTYANIRRQDSRVVILTDTGDPSLFWTKAMTCTTYCAPGSNRSKSTAVTSPPTSWLLSSPPAAARSGNGEWLDTVLVKHVKEDSGDVLKWGHVRFLSIVRVLPYSGWWHATSLEKQMVVPRQEEQVK